MSDATLGFSVMQTIISSVLYGLSLLPQLLHLVEREFADRLSGLLGALLYMVETGNELAVGALESVLGIYFVQPGRIDNAEEQVAELGFDVVGLA